MTDCNHNVLGPPIFALSGLFGDQIAHPMNQDYARSLDEKDDLRWLRKEFQIPTKGELKKKTVKDGECPVKRTDLDPQRPVVKTRVTFS